MHSVQVYSLAIVMWAVLRSLPVHAESHVLQEETGRAQVATTNSSSKSPIPKEACAESDVVKYTGEGGLEKKFDLGADLRLGEKAHENLGMRKSAVSSSPYALFIQKEDATRNPEFFDALPDMGPNNNFPTHIHRFHNALHPQIHENFQALFLHALSCLEKDEPGFLLGLKKIIRDSLYTDDTHSAFSGFLGKVFNANTREEEDYPQGYNGETQNTINRLLSRLKALEEIKDFESSRENPQQKASILTALNNYVSKPPSQESLAALSAAIRREQDPNQSHALSGLVSQAVAGARTTAFLGQQQRLSSPQEGAGFFGKRGATDGLVSSAAVAYRVSQQLTSFDSAFKTLKESFNTGKGGLSPEESQIAWARFQEALGPELKRMTPEQIIATRELIFSQLRNLDSISASASDPLDTALGREALLKAGHALELALSDPAASQLPAREQTERRSYGFYLKNLQAFLQSKEDPRFQEADSAISRAESQFQMAVPLASLNEIRKADPFLLGLLKNEKGALHPQAKQFFESGFSTHLFNPVSSGKGAAGLELNPVVAGISKALEATGALEGFSPDERRKVADLLLAAGAPSATEYPSPFYNKPQEWQKAYQALRDRLLGRLGGGGLEIDPSDKNKALALAIEVIDSTGNHAINPYAPGNQAQFHDVYQIENVLARLQEEKGLHSNGASDAATAIRDLVHGIQGIPSRARLAQSQRDSSPENKEEQEILELYRDLLTQGGKVPLSTEAEAALKKFAFDKQIPGELLLQLSNLIPGIEGLGLIRGLPEGSLPGVLLAHAPEYAGAVKARDAAELNAIEQIRRAIRETPGFLDTQDEMAPERYGFLADLKRVLEARPGSLASLISEAAAGTDDSVWFNSQLAPLVAQVPGLQKALRGVQTAQGLVDARAERALEVGTQDGIPDMLPVLYAAGEAAAALGALQARLGKDHPTVKRYQAEFASRFKGAAQLDQLVGRLASQEQTKLAADSAKRMALLERFKRGPYSPERGLQFDAGLNAFLFTDKTEISNEMLEALERDLPDAKFVWRDSRAYQGYQDRTFSLHDLKQGLFDQDQALALRGINPQRNEWFPIAGSSVLAGRWVKTGNGQRFEFANVNLLRERFNQKRKETQQLQDVADRAVGHFERFWHGAKDIILNPFGWGYDPNNGSEDKELWRARHAFSKAREQLGEFGLIGPAGLLDGRNALQRFLDHETRLYHNTNQAAQRYVENAELAAELEGIVLTLPFAPIGGAAAALTRVPRAARGAYLLAGVGRGLLHLDRAARAGATFAGITAGTNALFHPDSLLMGDARRREIEALYEKRTSWRKHSEQPDPQKYYRGDQFDEARYQRDWAAWQEEEMWDRNGNGIPDFKEPHLRDVAYQGTKTPFKMLVESPAHSYKSMYGISLMGGLTPGLGFAPHVGVPHFLEQSMHYAAGAGKPGDFNNRLTAWDVAQSTLVSTATILPAIYAPSFANRFLPSRIHGPVPFGRIGIGNMQVLAGTGAATTAGVGTAAALNWYYGGNPWEALDPSNVLISAYIGRGMAQNAALKSAQADLLSLRPDPARPGQLLLPGGKPTENAWEVLVRKHGQKTVDMAVTQLQTQSAYKAERADIHGTLAQYQMGRASQVRTQAETTLQGNPFKDSTVQVIEARLKTLQSELSGARGLGLAAKDPAGFAAMRAELQQARQALGLKAEALYFEESAQGFRSLQAFQQLRTDLIAQPRTQSEWRKTISEAPPETRPFLEELAQIARETPSRNSQWWERAQERARQDNLVGALMGSVINPHYSSSTPLTRAERAATLLGQVPLETLPSSAAGRSSVDYRGEIVRQYVLSRASNPQVAERLFTQLRVPESTSREVLTQIHREFGQGLALRFQKYLGLAGRDGTKTLDQHFYDFMTAEPTLSLPGSRPQLLGPQ